ncbi:hypothetical protein BDF14DRAFT_1720602, partial [Spinellus fusiger]
LESIWQHENSFEEEEEEEKENEFDPTLQYYHGTLLDHETVQDMHLLQLSVTNPSYEETQADNVDQDMSVLQMLQSIFTDLSSQQLQEALVCNDYDMDRTMESLLGTPAPEEDSDVPKKRQVCRHFLAGECYRKDCWFAHDLQVKVCKFWLQGSCFKGDVCEFSHHFDVQHMATKAPSQSKEEEEQMPPQVFEESYPRLSSFSIPPTQPTETRVEEFPTLQSAAKMQPTPPATKKPIAFSAMVRKRPTHLPPPSMSVHKTVAPRSMAHRLRQPVKIPWFETGSVLNSQYLQQRAKAIEYGMLRNRFFSRATEFYLKGHGAKARAYSQEAKHYNRLMQEMHAEASGRIFEQRNQYETFIDLHGLHVDEALGMLETRLHKLRGYQGVVYLVTGTGHHSGTSGVTKRESKLKPSVEAYLREERYPFAEISAVGDTKGGVFAVDLS